MCPQPLHPVRLDKPVCPSELYRRLHVALRGVQMASAPEPLEIVRQPFPAVDDPAFRDTYLLREVLRKYPDFDLGVDRAKAAIASFYEDEALNAETNNRLHTHNERDARVRHLLLVASRKAVRVLGRFDWDLFAKGLRFGPGATTSMSRRRACVENKLLGDLHVTRSAYRLAEVAVSAYSPSWARFRANHEAKLVIHDEGRFALAPKNALTDRTIDLGPDFNVMAQLSVDYQMRRKLDLIGINLSRQDVNQTWAYRGSLDGSIATEDAKSASNSLTCALVWHLLGNHFEGSYDPNWYRILDALRVERTLMPDGRVHTYELFSAMGNGATFGLQTLIFYSLAFAVCKELNLPVDSISVYGDDVIIPTEGHALFQELLAYVGVRLNPDKSFFSVSAPFFRESCGVHFLDGVDVTPFYVDKSLASGEQVLLLANNLARWSLRADRTRDDRIRPVYEWVVSHLPPSVRRCRIPWGSENDGLIGAWDESVSTLKPIKNPGCPGISGWRCRVVQRVFPPRGPSVPLSSTDNDGLDYQAVEGDDVRLLKWFYHAEVMRFSRPHRPSETTSFALIRARSVATTYTRVVDRSAVYSRSTGDYRILPPDTPGDAERVRFRIGKRGVTNWPYIGPWL